MLVLLARKMAIYGLRDASATMLAMQVFGSGFRRPLALLRCFMHEVATCSNRNISVAPCCAPRMTRDEALLIDALATADLASLAALTDNDDCGRALTVALALREEIDVLERRMLSAR
ncbi:hypothetical protein ELI_08285 [Erythrobacter litoralis HTCC2594]|uniref:Uncharacterized protein n=1 Tax=Erythrobacter litoralis (strain HTCC2594) TaxID=314225 RepID=Q2N992_ERYLH|nr:hypothetical protein ELI_08285 [Erythrobacter litoralis HTCC2594]